MKGPPLAWLDVLRSVVFWVAALGMVVYVIRSYLRDHPELLAAFAALAPVRTLRGFLSALWRRLAGLTQAVNARLPRRFSLRRARGAPSPLAGPFRFLRLSALSPRERVLYYYLSILHRAGQQGFPRRRSQTPREYDDTLSPHLEQAEQEMHQLTHAFVEARYSHHILGRERDRQVRAHWKQVKAALQVLKRNR